MDRQRIRHLALSIVASALLLLPALGLFRAPDRRMAEEEQRPLAARPEFPRTLPEWLAAPAAWEKFFADNFAFRRQVIQWRNEAKVFLLGVSSNPQVVLGQEGWLFYNANQQLSDHRGLRPLAEQELNKFLLDLEAKVAQLAAVKIPYLLILVPEKHVVYPEYLPARLNQKFAPSRFDQIVAGLTARGQVPFLDLRPFLLAAKANDTLYYKYDSHWNQKGAFVAYRQVMAEIRKWLPTVPILAPEQVQFHNIPPSVRDLARLLALSSRLREAQPQVTIHAARGTRDLRFAPLLAPFNDQSKPPWQQPFATSNPAGVGQVILYGDSFAEALTVYFGESFREAINIQARMSPGNILELRKNGFSPELVLEELVVRHL